MFGKIAFRGSGPMSGLCCAALLLLIGSTAPIRAAAPAPDATEQPVLLPERLLDCSIGHVINFDPAHEQTADQLRYDTRHHFVVFLARHRRLVGVPPDPLDKAPKVDPRTRIIADPDHISAQPGPNFGRLIDQWPERVELSTPINADGLLNAIVLNPIDEAGATAWLFMLRATELTHFDPAHIYQGTCHILTGKAATEAEHAARYGASG